MAVEDVALALVALDDTAVRARVRGGDWTALGERDFTDEERKLVSAAAEDDSEVAGFDYTLAPSANAFAYVSLYQSQLSVGTKAQFSSFLAVRFGGGVQVQGSLPCGGPPGPPAPSD